MERSDFEHLRDLPGKTIAGDISLQKTKDSSPLYCATVSINTTTDVEARLRIEWNEQTDAKTLNVWIPGNGPICRLEVDSRPHRPYGRHHKHSLQQPDCSHPSINLSRQIHERADLEGKSIKEVFTDFCYNAKINHNGDFKIIT